jgi:hypothetical protein
MSDTSDSPHRKLLVKTVYYRGVGKDAEPVKIIRSGKALRAMQNAFGYMRQNVYEADVAEVYHNDHGKLYGVLRRTVEGQVKPLFEEPLKKGE